MSDLSLTQLGLFDNPLPIKIARDHQFTLDYHFLNSVLHYRAIDWLTGLVDEKYAKQAIKDLRKKGGLFTDPKWGDSIHSLQERDSRNRLQKVEYVTDVLLYRLTIRVRDDMKADKQSKIGKIHDYLANAGAFADEARIDPVGTAEKLLSYASRQRHAELDRYGRYGLTDKPEVKRLKLRTDSIDTYNDLMANVKRTIELAHGTPDYRSIADAENLAMFGMVASGLRVILNTKSVRDALPDMQLSGLQYGETCLIEFLKHTDGMTNKQVLMAVDTIIRPIGEHLKQMSAMMGIHPVTGQKLLKANNYAREDEV